MTCGTSADLDLVGSSRRCGCEGTLGGELEVSPPDRDSQHRQHRKRHSGIKHITTKKGLSSRLDCHKCSSLARLKPTKRVLGTFSMYPSKRMKTNTKTTKPYRVLNKVSYAGEKIRRRSAYKIKKKTFWYWSMAFPFSFFLFVMLMGWRISYTYRVGRRCTLG